MSSSNTNGSTNDSLLQPWPLSHQSVMESIDPGTLAQLRSHFDHAESTLSAKTAFKELIDLFISELPRRLNLIREAIGHADTGQMAAAAHALRGSSLLLGAMTMAGLCLEIELAAKAGLVAPARASLALLLEEGPRVRQALMTASAGA
jgi:HPt (histidine-containing phosphotransfer) domain-containing protein